MSTPIGLLTAVLAIGYAWVCSGLESHSVAATAAVAGPAAAVTVVVLRRPGVPDPLRTPDPRLRRTRLLWSVLLAAGLLWEAYAFFQQPAWTVGSYDHPTLSVLLDPVLEYRPVRFLGWLLWLGAGRRLLLMVAKS